MQDKNSCQKPICCNRIRNLKKIFFKYCFYCFKKKNNKIKDEKIEKTDILKENNKIEDEKYEERDILIENNKVEDKKRDILINNNKIKDEDDVEKNEKRDILINNNKIKDERKEKRNMKQKKHDPISSSVKSKNTVYSGNSISPKLSVSPGISSLKFQRIGYPGRRLPLYHLTNKQSGMSIIQSKKMLPGKHGMYGPGIYFAETVDICKRKTQNGDDFLITALVTLEISCGIYEYDHKICSSLNYNKVSRKGFGSVMGLPGRNSVSSLEYVVYRTIDVEVIGGEDITIVRENPEKLKKYVNNQINYLKKDTNNDLREKQIKALENFEIFRGYDDISQNDHISNNLNISSEIPTKKSENTGYNNNSISNKLIVSPEIPSLKFVRIGFPGRRLTLYHLTNKESGISIIQSKKMFPGKQGTYGPGIYFAETVDICKRKSLNGDEFLITALVNLEISCGIYEYDSKICRSLNYDKISREGFGSVMGLPGRNSLSELEYVVYRTIDVEVIGGEDITILRNNPEKLKKYVSTQINYLKKDTNNDLREKQIKALENFEIFRGYEISYFKNIFGSLLDLSDVKVKKKNKNSIVLNYYTTEEEGKLIMESKKIKPIFNGKYGTGFYLPQNLDRKKDNKNNFIIKIRVTLGTNILKLKNYSNNYSKINHEIISKIGCNSVLGFIDEVPYYILYRESDIEIINRNIIIDNNEMKENNIKTPIKTKKIFIQNPNIKKQPSIIDDNNSNNEIKENNIKTPIKTKEIFIQNPKIKEQPSISDDNNSDFILEEEEKKEELNMNKYVSPKGQLTKSNPFVVNKENNEIINLENNQPENLNLKTPTKSGLIKSDKKTNKKKRSASFSLDKYTTNDKNSINEKKIKFKKTEKKRSEFISLEKQKKNNKKPKFSIKKSKSLGFIAKKDIDCQKYQLTNEFCSSNENKEEILDFENTSERNIDTNVQQIEKILLESNINQNDVEVKENQEQPNNEKTNFSIKKSDNLEILEINIPCQTSELINHSCSSVENKEESKENLDFENTSERNNETTVQKNNFPEEEEKINEREKKLLESSKNQNYKKGKENQKPRSNNFKDSDNNEDESTSNSSKKVPKKNSNSNGSSNGGSSISNRPLIKSFLSNGEIKLNKKTESELMENLQKLNQLILNINDNLYI